MIIAATASADPRCVERSRSHSTDSPAHDGRSPAVLVPASRITTALSFLRVGGRTNSFRNSYSMKTPLTIAVLSNSSSMTAARVAELHDFFMYEYKCPCATGRSSTDLLQGVRACPHPPRLRRHPRLHSYKQGKCLYFDSAQGCLRGVECPFSHTTNEARYHPVAYKTKMCERIATSGARLATSAISRTRGGAAPRGGLSEHARAAAREPAREAHRWAVQPQGAPGRAPRRCRRPGPEPAGGPAACRGGRRRRALTRRPAGFFVAARRRHRHRRCRGAERSTPAGPEGHRRRRRGATRSPTRGSSARSRRPPPPGAAREPSVCTASASTCGRASPGARQRCINGLGRWLSASEFSTERCVGRNHYRRNLAARRICAGGSLATPSLSPVPLGRARSLPPADHVAAAATGRWSCPGSHTARCYRPAVTEPRLPDREKIVLAFVLAFLEARSIPAQLLVNGGYVRDLLGKTPDDLDLSLCLRDCAPDVTIDSVMGGLSHFAAAHSEHCVTAVKVSTILSDASKDKNVDTGRRSDGGRRVGRPDRRGRLHADDRRGDIR